MLQAGRSRVRFPMRSLFISPNPSSRTMALCSTQPLTKITTRNLPGGKEQPALKADNNTVICEPIVLKVWEPRRLTTLWASTTCYRNSFTFLIRIFSICTHIQTAFSAAFCAFLIWPLLFHVLPKLHDMFRSHKNHHQVCMLLHVNCNFVGTLITCYVLNSFFTLARN
jgi:hypothetical protein